VNPSRIAQAVLLGVAVAAASTASFSACSGNGGGGGGDDQGEEGTGTLSLQLTLPGGESVDTAAYVIHGPTTYTGTSSVVGSGSTFGFVIPDVAPGSGYTITITARSVDGTVTCAGDSSPFSVQSRRTTLVNVLLACTTTMEAGSVVIQGTGFACASWHTAVADPATAATGGTVALVGFASGPDPGAITYQWSATAGTIAGATTANAKFTCPATPGDVTITLTVGDGAVPEGGTCPTDSSATTLTVTCQ